jgi:6-pyruvoyltetrahydropterin/6-carboxytetrahydropterin synthase
MAISLTRTVSFPATHRMYRPEWSAEENRQHFGPVAEYHTHQYQCAVTVSGPLDPATGMLVDLAQLDRIIAEEVVERMSGRTLNTDLPELASGRPLPTCEALVSILYPRLAARLPAGLRLLGVRVAEDSTLHAEQSGEF